MTSETQGAFEADTGETVAPIPLSERLPRTPGLLPGITFIAILSIWEVGTRLFQVPTYVLPPPSRIVQGFDSVDLARWGQHVWATLRVALMGFATSIIVSLPIAIGLAKSRLMSRAVYPLLVVIQSVPVVAVAPIIVVVLGTDDAPRIVITFLISFFPLVVSMTTGLMATPPELLELSRSLRASGWREITQIRIPYAIPYFFSGLKISITLCIIWRGRGGVCCSGNGPWLFHPILDLNVSAAGRLGWARDPRRAVFKPVSDYQPDPTHLFCMVSAARFKTLK